VVGDNVTAVAKAKGVAAIVIDGMARDIAGIAPVGLPVFARGITPNSCVRSGPGRVGLPIVIGGVAVESGDLVIGDADGVVVLPRVHLHAILPSVEEVLAAEAATQAKIRNGFTNIGGIEDILASDRVRYVD
jgi:4-hydroxy-4-methyl-2-oxoglutarate aldolase